MRPDADDDDDDDGRDTGNDNPAETFARAPKK